MAQVSLAQFPLYSVDEYLALEQMSNIRHEYIDGVIVARVGTNVPGQSLQQPQPVLFQRDIEQHFDVVEQNHVGRTRLHDFTQQAQQLQCPRPLGEVQQPLREFEVDVDQRRLRAFVDCVSCQFSCDGFGSAQ